MIVKLAACDCDSPFLSDERMLTLITTLRSDLISIIEGILAGSDIRLLLTTVTSSRYQYDVLVWEKNGVAAAQL